MLVENRMKRDPITISPETGILEASRLLRQHKIRHLPVVRERAGDIASIMTARATYRGEERKVLIVRIETDDPEETVKAIEKAGYPVLSAAV